MPQQPTYQQAGIQHLALRQQDSEHQQVALEPRLQHRALVTHRSEETAQAALVAVQALEHQRIASAQHQVLTHNRLIKAR